MYHRKQNNPLPPTSNQNQAPPEVRNSKQPNTQYHSSHNTTDRQTNCQPGSQTSSFPEQYNDANILFIKKFAGYGFIYAPGQNTNIYFHATEVLKNQFYQLEEGSDVNFRLIKGPRVIDGKKR
ncbi:cold-shock protein [Teredinibacter haidensis]|uniref:cold-shock protein n=1 Tax=Teredinibacter haidensis TaxID=2731755 RepID=UPI001FE64DAE|nr:cold shock domain-containing protein [Teredinibacter haidensis]